MLSRLRRGRAPVRVHSGGRSRRRRTAQRLWRHHRFATRPRSLEARGPARPGATRMPAGEEPPLVTVRPQLKRPRKDKKELQQSAERASGLLPYEWASYSGTWARLPAERFASLCEERPIRVRLLT